MNEEDRNYVNERVTAHLNAAMAKAGEYTLEGVRALDLTPEGQAWMALDRIYQNQWMTDYKTHGL